MFNNDKPNLFAIKEACGKIIKYTVGITSAEVFYQEEKVFDAVLMNFIVIGESVAKLSNDLKNQYQILEWDKIKSFRNIVAHNYFGVDADEVWQIIGIDIPFLDKTIDEILKSYN